MNSGDTSGDRSRVVGYGSVAFFDRASNAAVEADDPETPTTQEAERRFHLTNADKRRLFEIARESISLWQNEQRRKDYPDESENLNAPAAAFVTLHRDGELRGCVGSVESDEPLWMNVREMAIAAATRDTRFEPLWPGELEACDLEISVMTPLTRVTSPDEIVPGEHGILLRRGYQRGLLLPQVAAKYGWDAREFLRQTCRKAGMEDDAWRDPATEIDVFSAVVFSEKDVQGVDADVH
ncbi:AmmeMemoRadiSam system protein A [bacterium]|nr:AmmeMemoRadiSam system protein A [bacterium]MCB9475419.1 AmmeMemoRadiSam system protein A [Deltaproteobacteria bacterium]MCB9478498.1 AmmeMemoRadiSam system protein A [Deltaproteobacteria bacterium]